MTTLEFGNGLVDNPFSGGNIYSYDSEELFGLYATPKGDNYPYILKGMGPNRSELTYSDHHYQLRGRRLTTKKLVEVMNTARMPIRAVVKHTIYLAGKGFLSTYDASGNHKILFIACIDDSKTVASIAQVKFYVSKDVYSDSYKNVQPAIKELVSNHPGDIIMCNNIGDYVGEKIKFPKGGSIADRNKYKEAIVRAALAEHFGVGGEPLVVEAISSAGTEHIVIYDGVPLISSETIPF
jgi:hypothetical protein